MASPHLASHTSLLLLLPWALACSATDVPSSSSGTTAGSGLGSDADSGPSTTTAGESPCNLDTGYDGDELCILPPDPSVGFQLHVGPEDYDDPDQIDAFLLDSGAETVECWYEKTGNTEDMYNSKRRYRMRPGSHHLLLKNAQDQDDGWGACPSFIEGGIGGSQNSVSDTGFANVAPEDQGYARLIEPHKQLANELHYFNATDAPILREVWVNFYADDPSTVTGQMNSVALIGLNGLVIDPHTEKTIRYGAENDVADRRIAGVVGHVHSHTVRFSAWKVSGDNRELVYELYDWAEPIGMRFNSVTDNPTPDAATLREGGHSGILTLDVGDRIEWECEVVNDLDTTLVFANEALTAEMCILFGSTTAASWMSIPDAPL